MHTGLTYNICKQKNRPMAYPKIQTTALLTFWLHHAKSKILSNSLTNPNLKYHPGDFFFGFTYIYNYLLC